VIGGYVLHVERRLRGHAILTETGAPQSVQKFSPSSADPHASQSATGVDTGTTAGSAVIEAVAADAAGVRARLRVVGGRLGGALGTVSIPIGTRHELGSW
jgi:hypothetical protein